MRVYLLWSEETGFGGRTHLAGVYLLAEEAEADASRAEATARAKFPTLGLTHVVEEKETGEYWP